MNILKTLLRAHWTGLILLYFAGSFFLNFYNDQFVLTDELYNDYLVEKYQEDYQEYDEFFDDLNDLEFLDETEKVSLEYLFYDALYILAEIVISIPILGLLFLTGFFLTKNFHHIKYGFIFKSVLIASFIFLVEIGIRSAYFTFFDTDHTFEEIKSFRPFHLESLLNVSSENALLSAFLELFNLYDLSFLLVFASIISIYHRRAFLNVLLVSSVTYFSAMLLWKVFILYMLKIL